MCSLADLDSFVHVPPEDDAAPPPKRIRIDATQPSSSASLPIDESSKPPVEEAPSPTPPVEEEEAPSINRLDAVQRRAVDDVLAGRNAFVTGAGGNGKSFTLKVIRQELEERGRTVAVTSSTGRSAVELDMGATTLHHFMALGDTGTKDVDHYVKRLAWRSMQAHVLTMRSIDTLIIDEVSMLSAQFLDKLSAIMAAVRRTEPSRAWGGVQIVYSGDFAQLRPVYRRQEMAERPLLAFEAEVAWTGANVAVHQLRTAHRQSQDAPYAELLERARFGRLRPADVALLRTRVLDVSEGVPDSMRGAMLLFATNRRVDEHNRRCMARLDEATSHVYRATISCSAKDAVRNEIMSRPRTTDVRKRRMLADKGADGRKWMRDNMRAVPQLELRANARVMLLANVAQEIGLANGCLGTVIGFDDESGRRLPIVRFDRSGIEMMMEPHEWKFDQHPGWSGTYSQVPLMLAYACTIHKSQGLTVDRVIADLSADEIRDAGMAYVVLSRVRSLEHILFRRFSPATVFADEAVRRFYGVE